MLKQDQRSKRSCPDTDDTVQGYIWSWIHTQKKKQIASVHIKVIILKPWNTNKWHIIKSTIIHASLESQLINTDTNVQYSANKGNIEISETASHYSTEDIQHIKECLKHLNIIWMSFLRYFSAVAVWGLIRKYIYFFTLLSIQKIKTNTQYVLALDQQKFPRSSCLCDPA